MNQEVMLNNDDKFAINKEEFKDEEEGVALINDVANKVYNIPRNENEINLYKVILNNITDKNDRKIFREFFDNVDKTLIHRNDIVQKVIISSVLLNKLFILKHKNENMDIFRITKGIPYKEDNGTWLKTMIEYTVPILVNNNLIEEFKDD